MCELNFYDSWDFYIFWEKSFDTASTHIYVKRYYFQDEPVALIEGDFHNIDPCLLRTNLDSWPPDDNLFYLLHLADEDGDFDIYYIIYTTNGITEPIALNNTTGNEKHLRSNSANGLTWDYEGKIMYSSLRKENNCPFYFTDPVVIDSGNCKNPVLDAIPSFNRSEKYLAWEKVINDSSKVIFVGVSDIWFYALMSYIKDENGQPDVYGGYQGSWPNDYVNLSNSSAIETNPHL